MEVLTDRRHRVGPCTTQVSLLPNKAVKITRNMRGKANVKNAFAGFRQKALFVNRT